MSFRIRPTDAPTGAIVTGLDVTDISRGEAADLYRAFLHYGLLIFRGLEVDDAGQLALSNVFGEAQLHPIEALRLPHEPMLVDFAVDNGVFADDDPAGDEIVNRLRWHRDAMYTERPLRGGLLRPILLPKEGGDTGWIDSVQVYADLPYRLKTQIQGLQVVQSYAKTGRSTTSFPEVLHPLVYIHPELDKPVLSISPSAAVRIVGLPDEEGAALLDELGAFSTEEWRAYRHHWEPGDMALWDNWRTLHCTYGHAKRYPRTVRRTSLAATMRVGRAIVGSAATLEQVA